MSHIAPADTPDLPPRPAAPFRRRLILALAVVGPGIIAANADNDASGIFGYSQAGAAFEYRMLWVLVLSTFALGVAQEICARMAAVTGKGLADLIREVYGVKVTLFAMAALLIANFATTVSEFAGILASVELFVPAWVRFIILPALAAGVWWIVMRGSYRRLERVLLGLSLIYLLYIVDAFMAHPHWGYVLRQTVAPTLSGVNLHDYVFMVINVVGTTITPWGQFYIQGSVRDKGVDAKNYRFLRWDVLFGAFFTNFIAFFIIVCCGATLYQHGMRNPTDALDVAKALKPLAGTWATLFFAVGLFNASSFGAVTVPLSTAYSVTEALGWESGVGRHVREAPLFAAVFTILIAASALIVMLFPANLGFLIILPNIVGAILLPIVLVLMLLLVNKRRIMGNYVNSVLYNWIAWATTVILIILSIVLLVTSL